MCLPTLYMYMVTTWTRGLPGKHSVMLLTSNYKNTCRFVWKGVHLATNYCAFRVSMKQTVWPVRIWEVTCSDQGLPQSTGFEYWKKFYILQQILHFVKDFSWLAGMLFHFKSICHGPVDWNSMKFYSFLFNRLCKDVGLLYLFIGQFRQMSSQVHFHVYELKLFCLSCCYYVLNSEFSHSISFCFQSNSFILIRSVQFRVSSFFFVTHASRSVWEFEC